MLTEEQKRKAMIALLKKGEDLDRMVALRQHKRAKQAFTRYGLPYRVYLDNLKRYEDIEIKKRDYVPINDCYPLPGYPIQNIIEVDFMDFDRTEIREVNPGVEYLNPDVKERVCIVMRNNIPCPLFSEEWEYNFLHFLKGYDFKSFTDFDFIGETGTMQLGDIRLLQKHYAEYQKKYESNPENYRQQEPPYLPEYKEQYSDYPYRIVHDKDTMIEKASLEREINIKPTQEERNRYIELYGIDVYADIE